MLHALKTTTAPFRARSFVDQIQIQCGDVQVLGRYFLQTETRLADMGLTLQAISPTTLLDIFDANRETWESIGPQFNNRDSEFKTGAAAIFAAYTATGEPVGTCGVRYFDLGTQTLTQSIASLDFMYGEQAPRHRLNSQCHLPADVGDQLTGRLILSGAQWIHPKLRGSGLAQIIVLVPRAYALSQWQFDFEMLIAKAKLARPQVARSYGLAHCGDGFRLIIDGQTNYSGMVFWSSHPHLAEQVAAAVSIPLTTSSDNSRDRDHLPAATRKG